MVSSIFIPYAIPVFEKNSTIKYNETQFLKDSNFNIPSKINFPFGCELFSVQPQITIKLSFNKEEALYYQSIFFRLTVASDDRTERRIIARLGHSELIIGELDIRFACAFQIFEFQIPDEYAENVIDQGISLVMVKGETPLYVFNSSVEANLFRPHLMLANCGRLIPPYERFMEAFLSLNSLQPFGWMEGCVMVGLLDLWKQKRNRKAKAILQKHLKMYFPKVNKTDSAKEYVSTLSKGAEGLAPFGVLSLSSDDHPEIDEMIKYCTHAASEHSGMITDGPQLAAEGNYQVAFPLAIVAFRKRNDDLARLAIEQLKVRQQYLCNKEGVWLRYNFSSQKNTYKNWGRGVVWYLLGLGKTLTVFKENNAFNRFTELIPLEKNFIDTLQWVMKFRTKEGLWYNYIDIPSTGIDTSTSAGLGAAMGIAIKYGWLSNMYIKEVKITLNALYSHLTPDGLLKSASQANKSQGGEVLQKEGYRVIGQYAMGLMAQLIASLE